MNLYELRLDGVVDLDGLKSTLDQMGVYEREKRRFLFSRLHPAYICYRIGEHFDKSQPFRITLNVLSVA